MKILSMYYKHKKGGFNKRLYQMYQALADRGHVVHYIAVEKFPIDHKNIKPHIFRAPFTKSENYLFWCYFLLVSPFYCLYIALKYKVDLIVVFGSWYAAFCTLAKVILKIPLITFVRCDSIEWFILLKKPIVERILNHFLELLGLRLSDKIIFNSNFLKEKIVSYYKLMLKNIDVIYNNIYHWYFIDMNKKHMIRQSLGLCNEDFVFVCSCIFYKSKNVNFLIQAFSYLKRHPRAKLLLIGDDVGQSQERKNLEKLVKSFNLHKQVIFTGWRNDCKDLIAASDLFVFPSRSEGFPNSLLDALSCGIPCIGSNVGSIREVLFYDELTFSLDSPKYLAKKMEQAIDNKIFYAHLKELSKKRAHAFLFDWDKIVTKAIISNK